jgi:hypothetical protein
MPLDQYERSFHDTFGIGATQDLTGLYIPKANLVAPPGLAEEQSWDFTPREENGSHELILALVLRWALFQSTSPFSELAWEPFILGTEYVDRKLFKVWQRTFKVRVETPTENNPSPSLLYGN